MRRRACFLAIGMGVFSGLLAAPAQTTDPVKLADLQARFKAGRELFDNGKFAEARKIFDGIIAEEPKARGSLLTAGLASVELNENAKAIDYLQKFRKLQPKDFRGVIFMLQANQALGRTQQAEELRMELLGLRSFLTQRGLENFTADELNVYGGSAQELKQLTEAKYYERQRVRQKDDSTFVVNEYYDDAQAPFWLWEGRQISAKDEVLRQMVVSVERPKDPALKTNYVFAEYIVKDGRMRQINIYRQELQRPDYDTCFKWFDEALKVPPKPLTVETVN